MTSVVVRRGPHQRAAERGQQACSVARRLLGACSRTDKLSARRRPEPGLVEAVPPSSFRARMTEQCERRPSLQGLTCQWSRGPWRPPPSRAHTRPRRSWPGAAAGPAHPRSHPPGLDTASESRCICSVLRRNTSSMTPLAEAFGAVRHVSSEESGKECKFFDRKTVRQVAQRLLESFFLYISSESEQSWRDSVIEGR